MGRMISYIMDNKSHVWNHQPDDNVTQYSDTNYSKYPDHHEWVINNQALILLTNYPIDHHHY